MYYHTKNNEKILIKNHELAVGNWEYVRLGMEICCIMTGLMWKGALRLAMPLVMCWRGSFLMKKKNNRSYKIFFHQGNDIDLYLIKKTDLWSPEIARTKISTNTRA